MEHGLIINAGNGSGEPNIVLNEPKTGKKLDGKLRLGKGRENLFVSDGEERRFTTASMVYALGLAMVATILLGAGIYAAFGLEDDFLRDIANR